MTTHGQTRQASLQEFTDGLDFWRRHPNWPADLHNSDYATWTAENPRGVFTLDWWGPFLRRLHAWKATRPATGADLTSRFVESATVLGEAWHRSCQPFVEADISTVTWE